MSNEHQTPEAVGSPVERPVRPADGVVLDRNGWPTLIVRGNEEAHVRHAGASYLYSQATLDAAVAAERARWMSAVSWALGTNGDFREQGTMQGRYWWRGELAERAGLRWDGAQWVDAGPNANSTAHPAA